MPSPHEESTNQPVTSRRGFFWTGAERVDGPWGTVIDILRGLLIAAGGLGFVLGMAVKGAAAGNADRQELGNRLMEGAIVGLFVGLLGEAIYNLIVGWTS